MVIIFLTILTSIGIFIGRFLRIHTIYLFLTPEMFIRPLINMWSHPAIIFIGLLTVVQLVFFYTLKLIGSSQFMNEMPSKKNNEFENDATKEQEKYSLSPLAFYF
ncbi:DUF1361 domain-containing protein [Lentilactobacillus kisonensis]|uniref:DUF1361 domain-containing protein n=1 Tax=Lentilactobacillus kisonensis TaxID=481722 RepID=UPI0034E2B309